MTKNMTEVYRIEFRPIGAGFYKVVISDQQPDGSYLETDRVWAGPDKAFEAEHIGGQTWRFNEKSYRDWSARSSVVRPVIHIP